MRQKSGTSKAAADKLVRGIKRKSRKHYSAEEKIRIVLAGLLGEESIAALYRREGIAERLYYLWSKEFLEAGKGRLGERAGRMAEHIEAMEATNAIQCRMLNAAARRPRTRDELARRLHDGRF